MAVADAVTDDGGQEDSCVLVMADEAECEDRLSATATDEALLGSSLETVTDEDAATIDDGA